MGYDPMTKAVMMECCQKSHTIDMMWRHGDNGVWQLQQ